MTPAELAAHDLADRRRVLDAAIAEEHRGRAIRQAAGAHSVAGFDANIARLERLRAQLDAGQAAA